MRPSRWQLGIASAAVLVAAADTYVVVLALPAIMADVGIPLNQLQRAVPIVSGFLLGYVTTLPLLGRLSDVYGRRPVFVACLAAFALGSILTATAQSLPPLVAGRTLQGLGGGGLVPVTLALVADLWPAGRRGAPLGVVGAVQELGSLLGPLYGAAIITVSGWRTIFWVNVPLATVLGAAFWAMSGRRRSRRMESHRRDIVGAALLGLGLAAGLLALIAPGTLTDSDTLGVLYQPLVTDRAAATPIAAAAYVLLILAAGWELIQPFAIRPLLPLRSLPSGWRRADWTGATLLAIGLGAIVLSFSTADPSTQVIAPVAEVLLPVAALAGIGFVVRERRARAPLIELGALSDRAAVGALLTNLTLGGALMAALIDVPLFARATVDHTSQVHAALQLSRFLVAIPVGAALGGVLCERLSYRGVAGVGMALSAVMFLLMSHWTETTLGAGVRVSDVVLAACGLGFGLAIAPVNAAILGGTPASIHGVASALAVVARTIGMLLGLALLTAIGLRHFYAAEQNIPSPLQLCPRSPAHCAGYDALVTQAVVSELHVIFLGAAGCAGMAAVLAVGLLRRRTAVAAGQAPLLTATASDHG